MMTRSHPRLFQFVVLLVAASLVCVFVLHATTPHHHPHQLIPLGPFGFLHNGLAENVVPDPVPRGIFIASAETILGGIDLLHSARRLGAQTTDAYSGELYRRLFAQGIIHPSRW